MRSARRVFGWIYSLLCEGGLCVLSGRLRDYEKAMKALQTRYRSLLIARIQLKVGSAKLESTGLPQLQLDFAGVARPQRCFWRTAETF